MATVIGFPNPFFVQFSFVNVNFLLENLKQKFPSSFIWQRLREFIINCGIVHRIPSGNGRSSFDWELRNCQKKQWEYEKITHDVLSPKFAKGLIPNREEAKSQFSGSDIKQPYYSLFPIFKGKYYWEKHVLFALLETKSWVFASTSC